MGITVHTFALKKYAGLCSRNGVMKRISSAMISDTSSGIEAGVIFFVDQLRGVKEYCITSKLSGQKNTSHL